MLAAGNQDVGAAAFDQPAQFPSAIKPYISTGPQAGEF